MIHFIIGGILVVGGALISLLVPRAMKNKNVEIKFAKTLSLDELKKQLLQSEADGLTDFRQYAEIKGQAGLESGEKTPYSEREVAYYKAECYEVREEMETYTDDTGTHQRTKRTENLVSTQKSNSGLTVKDASGETASIELSESGMQFDAAKTFDKFEPLNAMNQYGFFGMLNIMPSTTGIKTQGYRMVEYTIGLGQQLYVLGDALLNGGRVVIRKPADKKLPFIVSVKSEEDLVRANERGGKFALVGGIVSAVAGVLVILLLK
jgi:hypothetical protein